MRKEKQKTKVGLGVGYVSALLIFAVLVLTVFAVMSFNAAASTDKFNERSGEYLKQYYEADSKAKRILSELHACAVEAAQSGFFEDVFEETAGDIEGVALKRTPEGYAASYSVEINDRQTLAVSLLFDSKGGYKTEKWQSRGTDWDSSDDHLNVWDGSDMFD